MLDLVAYFMRSGFQKGCCFCQLFFYISIICKYTLTGQCFDTSYTGCNTCLGYDLECLDLAGICHMGTAAELDGEVSHGYNTYVFGIFFPKQCHCSCFLGFVNVHDLCHNRKVCLDFFIYQCFCLCDLFCCHGFKMCEVKTQSVRSYQGTFLFYMVSEYGFECFLQQMRCTVVLAGICSFFRCNFQRHFVADFEHALCHISNMSDLAAQQFDRFFYFELSICGADHTGIAFLSAHGCIERCLFYEDRCLVSVRNGIYNFCLRCKYGDVRFIRKFIVSYKFGCDGWIDLIVNGCIFSHVVGYFS